MTTIMMDNGFWDYNKSDCFHTMDSILVVQSMSRKLI